MGLYESLGREADRAASLHAEYRRLLAVVAVVASGELPPGRVAVDLAADSWRVLPDPAEKETVGGTNAGDL